MSKNTTILKNASYLVFRTLLVSLIGLFTVREVLRLLGIEDYGLFNVVFGVATLFTFINGAMISSSQRYLAYFIGKNDKKKLNEVWASSLFLHLLIAALVCIILLFSKNFILDGLLSISLKHKEAAHFIFNLAIVSVFITIFQSPFNAMILAKEKMSFYAKISLLNGVIKLSIVYILCFLSDPLLVKYTLLYVLSSLLTCILYILYCYKKLDQPIIFKIENISLLKEIFIYSSWNIFGNFASVAKLQGINVLLNLFFGVALNAVYAITNTINGVILGLINSVTIAINPQIYKSYAEENYKRSISLINSGSKFNFYFCLLVSVPIFINAEFLLEMWLSNVPKYLVDFLKFSLIVMLVDCLSGTLMTGIQATGRVKTYQIVVSISVFMNLPLSYMALKFTNFPWIIYSVALFLSLISLTLRLYFLNKLTGFSIRNYINLVLIKVLLVLLNLSLCLWFFLKLQEIENTLVFFILSTVVIIFSLLISIGLFGLGTSEKKFIQAKIQGYLK
ncbi:hypothetical protein E0H83_06735 [Acinetobacter terrestris]|uniref:oligosaccharide flippase family protein n=1 Tax=Acinetobacter terrestris TaxID=2529843 RepID=UPI00103DD8FE|nr:oligosaccharide flippase family protein [Acinetobacter terrestris]TCB46548.1 hypothetical protein E0H83_06735 [Acinetobacter terrestris]